LFWNDNDATTLSFGWRADGVTFVFGPFEGLNFEGGFVHDVVVTIKVAMPCCSFAFERNVSVRGERIEGGGTKSESEKGEKTFHSID
jgi:hypothetical protein